MTTNATTNEQRLYAALEVAIADTDFIGDNKKVEKAIEALTPKDTVTSVFKRLQGIARKDFLDKQDQELPGYTSATRDEKIKQYVHDKFKTYMENPKTAIKATELFNSVYGDQATESQQAA
jgi:hypothetical protein